MSFWESIFKLLFIGKIKNIEHSLKNDPRMVEKNKELDKSLKEFKKMVDDFIDDYGGGNE
ncbi:MAG: hypothetical protein KAT48_15085 [Bacteroidales bacterium]|nr:hypothetical protein [Bacteroidales bacterium]